MHKGFVSDLRIIDVSQGVAGPLASKLLADQGAEVIKVEPPAGDYSRRQGPFPGDSPDPEESLTYAFFNTSKKGVTLDVRTPDGAELLTEMASRSDVLIEDLPPGRMSELGLGYERLAKINPGLIMVSITPFGQTGPYKDYAWEDVTLQALTGFLYLSGNSDKPPARAPLEQAQIMGGRNAANAVMLAALERSMSGQGQHVDVSMAEAVATEPPFQFTHYSFLGIVSRRTKRVNVPVDGDFLPCRDGYITMASSGGNTWEELALFFDAPELLDDRFSDRLTRSNHAEELNELMVSRLKDRDKHEVFNAAMSNGFVFGVAQTPQEVLDCPHLEDRGYYQQVEHPTLGKLRYTGSGFRVDGEQCVEVGPPPRLGQHNFEIYHDWLGRSGETLARLRASGAI